jgi:hypothetical protein
MFVLRLIPLEITPLAQLFLFATICLSAAALLASWDFGLARSHAFLLASRLERFYASR